MTPLRLAISGGPLAAALFVAAAAAETSPLHIEGIGWENCQELFDDMIEMHQSNGFAIMAEETTARSRSAFLTSAEELLTITCDRTALPITFDQRATPL